jgi:hypothetical protein
MSETTMNLKNYGYFILVIFMFTEEAVAWCEQIFTSCTQRTTTINTCSVNGTNGGKTPVVKRLFPKNPSPSPTNKVSVVNLGRRTAIQMTLLLSANTLPAAQNSAVASEFRSEFYAFQKTDDEWKSQLTTRQYEIL